MNKTVLMSIVAMAISIAFVSIGMTQQALAAAQPAAPGQKAASAQTAPARENWGKVRGVIENVNEATKEVTVQSQKEKMIFSVGEQTKISEMTTKLSFSDLKKGMPVTVEYKKEGNKPLAEWIDVTKNMEAKPATQAKKMEGKKMEVKKENASEKATEKK